MTADLQRLAEALATRLERAVAIDDAGLRILAYTPHIGPVDEARTDSIMNRAASPQMRNHVLSHGIAAATEPMRVPGNDELAILPRVCAPIRAQTLLLGYVWLIDADGTLTDADLAAAQETADAAGLVLYREQLLDELADSRERELVRDLISDERPVREQAAAVLAEGEGLRPGTQVAAIVGRIGDEGTELTEDVRVAVATTLSVVRHNTPSAQSLGLARQNQVVLIVAPRPSEQPEAVARRLQSSLAGVASDLPVVVGVGSLVPLSEVHASYREASRALRVAGLVPGFDSVATVDRLGIYGLISQLPVDQLTTAALHPGLVALMGSEGGTPLVQTLETYLDEGGDARRTAELMNVHRASLYYRIGRIEELASVDLGRGEDRLALHLGLKVARLAGLWP